MKRESDTFVPTGREILKAFRDSIPVTLKKKIRRAASGRCYYCREYFRTSELTVDHKTPAARGGSNDKSNLIAACFACNHDKGNMTEEEYREAQCQG